ncbi:MAG: mannose-6-phosphate isomerase [Paenibacillus sp. RIFOXYA1_FULL_44_5]|nr:MAG: mannose-6-phosphate isomerase [Paenibacillus sp. RIFOXYA1_FULL_44_5]
MKPYPLKFKPELKERVWGGQNLAGFGLELPEGKIGEGWMISDHPTGITKVQNGELAGLGLDQVREQLGQEWLGHKGISESNGRFPLLIKLLDCNNDLSVQVHPDDHYDGLPAGELGKTEMWYIVSAKPGAKIIYGLHPGVDREELATAIAEHRIMDCLQEVEVEAGDTFYIPAGTVHALGAGVLVAEIQQNSDTVYRLYDYDRPGLDGKPRELHIEDSLRVIAYEDFSATRMKTNLSNTGEWLTLAASTHFVVEKGLVSGHWELSVMSDSSVIHVITEGEGTLEWDNGSMQLHPGDCVLVPANLDGYSLTGSMTVLRSYLP